MVIGGRNTGRVGIITHREKHASKYYVQERTFKSDLGQVL